MDQTIMAAPETLAAQGTPVHVKWRK